MDKLIQEFLSESAEGLDRMERCLTELEAHPEDGELIGEIFRAVHTIKGSTGFLGYKRLEKLAHAGESLLGELRDGKIAVSEALVSGLLTLMDRVRAILSSLEEKGGDGDVSSEADAKLIDLLIGLGAAAERVSADLGLPRKGARDMTQPDRRTPGIAEGAIAEPAGVDLRVADKSLRVGVDVLNRMMNLVGDLVLTRNQILQSDVAATFPELARRLDVVTADLRETVMQARMQPVGYLFDKFPRMVRDLGKTCGREVKVEISGSDTGLDKSLLEAIKDPLTHAVRNAVDHGVESPEARLQAGKPAQGCVRLSAFQQEGHVVIEVSDDGAGIEIPRVLAKAMEKNLVTQEQARGMTEREALQLLFLPGFSTAAKVTNVSGRGVGMDVVRSNVNKVGGSVEIESRAGRGTTLRMRMPLTLAIVPALVVQSAGESFAIPQSALAELVYITHDEVEEAIERIGEAEFYRLRESLLPMVWLDRLLELDPSAGRRPRGFYMAVLEAEGRRFGLVVEELLTPEEIVVKPLSTVLREIRLFSGATVLGNGTLAMILDVAEIAERAGVKAIEGTRRAVEEATWQADKAATVPLLVFEERDGERKALRLGLVERIQSVRLDAIEFAGGSPMLRYQGELLALKDEGGVLRELEPRRRDGVEATVLICGKGFDAEGRGRGRDGARRSGQVVRRVLDVAEGTWLEGGEWVGDRRGGTDLALVKDRVTLVCNPGLAAESDVIREVA